MFILPLNFFSWHKTRTWTPELQVESSLGLLSSSSSLVLSKARVGISHESLYQDTDGWKSDAAAVGLRCFLPLPDLHILDFQVRPSSEVILPSLSSQLWSLAFCLSSVLANLMLLTHLGHIYSLLSPRFLMIRMALNHRYSHFEYYISLLCASFLFKIWDISNI